MLDVNNIYVSSQNHGFDPERYLDAIDFACCRSTSLAPARARRNASTPTTTQPDPSGRLRERVAPRRPLPTLLEGRAHPADARGARRARPRRGRFARGPAAPAPPWLLAGAATALRRCARAARAHTGTLTAPVDAYAPEAVADARRPITPLPSRGSPYNRQYTWPSRRCRRLSAHDVLLGAWRFNDHAAFLRARPPRHWDIDRALDGFLKPLAETLEPGPNATFEAGAPESLQVPSARRPCSFAPTAADAARLLDARPSPSPAVAIFRVVRARDARRAGP